MSQEQQHIWQVPDASGMAYDPNPVNQRAVSQEPVIYHWGKPCAFVASGFTAAMGSSKNIVKGTLIAASALTVMSTATIAPSLPGLADTFGEEHSPTLIKLTLTLPSLFIALLAPFSGWLGDRVPRRRILLLATLLYAVAGSSGLYVDSLPLILVGRAFLGLAVAFTMTSATSLIGDYFTGLERQRFLGAQAASMSAGGIVFLTLGGQLAEWSWRGPFGVYLLSLIVAAAAIYLPKPPPAQQQTIEKVEKDSGGRGWAALMPVYFFGFAGMLIFYVIPVQIPFLIVNAGLGDPAGAGIAIAAANLTAGIGSLFLYVPIRKRISPSSVAWLAFIIVALGYLAVGFTQSYIQLLGAMLLTGLGLGFLMPNSNSWLLQKASPKLRSRAVGVMTSVIFAGQFVNPFIFSPLFTAMEPTKAFFAMGAVIAAISVPALLWCLAMGRR